MRNPAKPVSLAIVIDLMETDSITAGEWTFEVLDMDSTRVDKVLATWNPPQFTTDSIR